MQSNQRRVPAPLLRQVGNSKEDGETRGRGDRRYRCGDTGTRRRRDRGDRNSEENRDTETRRDKQMENTGRENSRRQRTNIRHFRDLEVYQLAMDSAMRIFELTKQFPAEEKYSLTDQIRRSSRSVCTNIAEACLRPRGAG